ncbi:MAG: nucleotidyltransferase family protein [Methanosarcinales archaeon]
MKQKGKRSLHEIEKILRENKPFLMEKFKIKNLGIFGSYLRMEQTKRSDIDILVEFNEVVDLLEYVELEEFLKKLMGIKVDLVSKKALRPELKDRILREVAYI